MAYILANNGIIPEGNKTITTNGSHNVTDYETAVVNVPTPPPVVETLNVTANGSYTPPAGVDGYDEVNVNVQEPDYLCFTAEQANSTVGFVLMFGTPTTEVSLQYSLDKNKEYWENFIIGTTTITLTNIGDKVYFKGNNNSFSGSTWQYSFSLSGKISLSGSIMSLLDGSGLSSSFSSGNTYVFKGLFSSCYGLKSAENLKLPAISLVEGCYTYMFYGCTNLTTPPQLPATTLAKWCYEYMFCNCTKLTTAPDLPATNISTDFWGPYYYMFQNCTSLIKPPKMPVIESIPFRGCQYMFKGCTSLISPPDFDVTNTVYGYGCSSMFEDCTSLIEIPTLSATTLYFQAYEYMFKNCTGLNFAASGKSTRFPTTGTGTAADSSLNGMFEGCSGTLPEGTGTPLINTTYYVEDRSGILKFSAASGYVTITNKTGYQIQYSETMNGTRVNLSTNSTTPADLSTVWLHGVIQSSGENWAASLLITGDRVSVSGLLRSNAEYKFLFYTQTALVNASNLICPRDLTNGSCNKMFSGCSSLTTPPTLPATNLRGDCYSQMFYYCTSLTTAPELPATTLAGYCYSGMFQNCTSLTTVPELPATTLKACCYEQMFKNCIGLVFTNSSGKVFRLPKEGTGTMGTDSTNNMFAGCSGTLPESTGTPLINTTYYIQTPEPIIPTGTKTITANGTGIDVYQYAKVNVSVPQPSGTKSITSNGTYDVTNYVSAVVNVPQPTPTLQTLNVTANGSYTPPAGVDGYDEVNVNVPQTGYDTSKMKGFSYSFYQAYSVDLTGINTSNATTMQYMFTYCYVSSIDVSPLDTSKVNNMSSMFNGCRYLTSLNLSNFNTSKVTNISSMFSNCSSLTELDLRGWDLSKVTDSWSSSSIFNNCSNLKTIYIGKSTDTTVMSFPAMDINTWSGLPSDFMVYVPGNLLYTYKTNAKWSVIADHIDTKDPAGELDHIVANSPSINLNLASKTAQIELVFYDASGNSNIPAAKKGVTYTVTSGPGTVDSSGLITATSAATVGDTITVNIVSTYDPTISTTSITTCTQPTYSIDLKSGQFVDSGTTVEGRTVYKSDAGSYHISNGKSQAVITINGYSSFTIKIRSYAESGYDYIEAFALDASTITRAGGIINTKNSQSASVYTTYTYTNIPSGTHTITLMYSKDGSGDQNDDRGYFYIPEQ